MKKIILSSLKILSIFTISIFILIPSIEASSSNCTNHSNYKECITNYNNYYFFIQPMEVVYEEGKKKLNDTANTQYAQTAFKPPELGASNGILTKINLSQKSSNNEDWTYIDFYDKYREIEEKGMDINYELKNVDVAKDSDNVNDVQPNADLKCTTRYISDNQNYQKNRYYLHGCYKDDRSIGWWGVANTSWTKLTEGKESSQLACASIDRNITLVDKDGNNTMNANPVNTESNSIQFSEENDTIIKREKIDSIDNLGKINSATDYNNSNTANCSDSLYTIKINGDSNKELLYSPGLYKYEYDVKEYSCIDNHQEPEAKCNGSNQIANTTCGKLTISTEGSLADVTINQAVNIVNILTPTSIYQGGGIKFGFIYYNTASWNYATGGRIEGEMYNDDVTKIMKNKLKDSIQSSIQSGLEVEIGGIKIDKSYFQVSCNQTGSFTVGNTLTTICTIFLPNSNVEMGTGKVDYNNSKYPNYGINNQYYTPLTFTGDYYVSAKLSGLNVLKTNKDDGIEDWTVTFDDPTTCKVNVTSRLYKEKPNNDKSTSYKFIYRPINLNDPFPDRNAGVNWYEWYSKDSNKKRLQESYSKLQYQVTLDDQKAAKIKAYNTNNNYLDWNNIENGKSEFIDTYFTTKRKNLGDDS